MITVFTGPMFAGKSEALWSVWKAASHPAAFKPVMDTRDAPECFITHAGNRVPCMAISTAGDILGLIPADTDAVIIDEGQFLGSALIPVVRRLSQRGLRVYVACLDMDSQGLPFGSVGDLMAISSDVRKLRACCAVCGAPATRSFRTAAVSDRDFIGGAESYEPRCEACINHD